jgi:hypothetical protein
MEEGVWAGFIWLRIVKIGVILLKGVSNVECP